MSEQHWTTIRVTAAGPHIRVLTMIRPAQRNAINAAMAYELEACLTSLKGDRDLRALVITGEGTSFGAGADLKERSVITTEQTQGARDAVLRSIDMIEALDAPVIAMINGPAIAGSFEIALACDIRVASERAVFALPQGQQGGCLPRRGRPGAPAEDDRPRSCKSGRADRPAVLGAGGVRAGLR